MTNQEIADSFIAHVPEGASKDFYDRFLDLAIYLNETTKETKENDQFKTALIWNIQDAMIGAYTLERI